MSHGKLTRRGFLNVAAGSVTTLTVGYLLAGCQPKEGATGGGEAAPAAPAEAKGADCTDISGLSDADKGTRTGLQYVDKSPDPAKNCDKCALYTQPTTPGGCGGCSVVKGPIAADASCAAFAAKA